MSEQLTKSQDSLASILEVQLDMFGAFKEDILRDFDRKKEVYGKGMQVLGRLSDTQEMIEFGDLELARQQLNVVKMLLAERILDS